MESCKQVYMHQERAEGDGLKREDRRGEGRTSDGLVFQRSQER